MRLYSKFQDGDEQNVNQSLTSETMSGWPDEFLGPLAPTNQKFPLPGNISVHHGDITKPKTSEPCPAEDLEESSNLQRHLGTLSLLIAESNMIDDDYDPNEDMISDGDISDSIIKSYFEDASVELAIQSCPSILYQDFNEIFLDMPKTLSANRLTVITITQKTRNDMTSWSREVEDEREELLKNFISTATEICHLLRANNFWSDFIDPSSGKAYFGRHSNRTMTETDENYAKLGFVIEDLGCCKVINHSKWDSHVFVGCVVTDAINSNPIIDRLLRSL